MEAFIVDARIETAVRRKFQLPRISRGWLRDTSRSVVEEHGIPGADFTIDVYAQYVEEAIRCTSFKVSAIPGTGLPNRINQERTYDLVEGPIVLELVHLTDIGCSPIRLERVRQHREHRALQERIALVGSSEGQALRELDWPLEQYPRKCLKLFLSDGSTELQAVELERLPFELGITPMGTKIRLVNVPIIAGVAYLRRENVEVIGGHVLDLQKEHRRRLFEELDRRMDEDEEEAACYETTVDDLYSIHT